MPASTIPRYRMDVFRGRRSSLRLATSDPRVMADEYDALSRVAPRSWRIELRDMHEGREGAIVSYQELRRRQRPHHGNYVSAVDQRAEASDKQLARAIARWARSTGSPRPPTMLGRHDWRRVREHAFEYIRDEGLLARDLDRAIDRIEMATRAEEYSA